MAQPLSQESLLALVDRLADGAWHSGEALAAESGISRAALAKRIDRLADWELAIEARQGLGYRLLTPIERLDAAALQRALGTRLRVRVLPVTDSTSSQLMAAAPGEDPQALLAEYQSAGRGRRGRSWRSPFGAQLALSLAWSFEQLPAQLTALPLAVGVVCARTLRAFGAPVALKWPNDLVVADAAVGLRKLGGILLEHRGEGGGGCRVVIGVGLNLALDASAAQAIEQPWINLDALLAQQRAPAVARNRLAAELLGNLAQMLEAYADRGFAPLAADWAVFDLTRDRAVRVQQGTAQIEGLARGVDAAGALCVETADGLQRLHAGEVSLRLAP